MADAEKAGITTVGGLVVERWLDEGPLLVLAHAGVADRRSWYGVIEALHAGGARLDVVAYDRRGFGASPKPAGPFSHLDDLDRLLDAVAGERPVWLVGSSAGGGLAIDTTLATPDRVAGLVLLAPAVTGSPEMKLDPDTERFEDRLARAEAAGDLDEVNRLETWLWLDGPSCSEGRVEGAARALTLDMNAIALRHNADPTPPLRRDAWDRLEEITAPTLVACGDLDVPCLIERSLQLADRVRGARYVNLPGRAHLPYLEDPTAIAALIEEALRT